MTKKLVIRFVKFERALAMQILEQVGIFKSTEHVQAIGFPAISNERIYLRGKNLEYDADIGCIHLNDNAERDKHFNNVIKWISEEQFSMGRKLEIGKECMVSLFDDIDGEDWVMGRLLAILPKNIRRRYIIQSNNDKGLATSWKYARPVSVFPKIDGDVYTWEMEVAE